MTIKVSLPDELGEFVDAQVASGRYASAGEVVRDAVRLMERQVQDQADRLAWLQEAYRVGIESGDAGPLDADDIKAEGRALLAKAQEEARNKVAD